jgi:mannan endo-1,4-beta-mannosidase
MNTCSLGKFVKKAIAVTGLCSVALPSMAIWTVKDGKILDPNGQPFIFRGVTVDHTAAPDKAVQAIKEAAAAGANAVQVEIAANVYNDEQIITGEELRSVIQACKDNKVVCVLEPNDVAGYPNSFDSASPDQTLGFWGYQAREAIAGQQDYVIIGMGNQALGDIRAGEYSARMQTYVANYANALPGFLIMIDGSNWGQDASKEMQAFAAQKYFAPRVIYSVEMSNAYTSPEKVRDYIASFSQIGAPLVVGSFSPVPYYHPHDDRVRVAVEFDLPAQSVMQYAEQYGAGYFGWSWSGNKQYGLDVVNNWDINSLTSWGNLLFNDDNGIKATAKTASIFSSSSSSSISSNSSSSSSSAAANNPPVAAITYSFDYVRCGQTYGNVDALSSYDPDGDSLTYRWEITGYFGTTISTESSVRFYMQPPHNYTIKLTVSDDKGASSTVTTVRNHTYSDNCVSSSSSSSIIRSSSSSIRPSSSSVPSSVSSSSIRPSSSSSSSRSSSSSEATTAQCSYVVNSQWNNGFTAAIRIRNTSAQVINGWDVKWQYNDGSKITNLWNAALTGSNPYNAKNLGWNTSIQPGQTVEFGFQGSKSAAAANVPVVTGSICK